MDGLRRYEARQKNKLLAIMGTFILLVVLAIAFTAAGETDVTVPDILRTLLHALKPGGTADTADIMEEKVILYLRLPRVALAVFGGFGLSVSGAVMQGITRNPLVSPFTIGISNAAAFGASLSIVFGFGFLAGSDIGVVLQAFLWALGCMVLVYAITTKAGMSPESMILTGIGLNYLFGAATSMVKYFADEHKLSAIVQWEFGSLNGARWESVAVVAAIVSGCVIMLFFFSPALNIMAAAEDETAKALGLNPVKIRAVTGILAVLATAAVISFTGVIGFVGLAGPHIARMVIGSDHRYLIPFSALTGAVLMLAADTFGRVILAPLIIPAGIVISFLGVPIFINLILTRRKGYFG